MSRQSLEKARRQEGASLHLARERDASEATTGNPGEEADSQRVRSVTSMWPGSQTTEFCQRSLGNRLQTHAMGSKPMISQEAFAFGTSGGSLDSSSPELRQEKRYRMTYHYKKAVIKGLEVNRSFSSSFTSFSDLKHCGEEVFTFVKLQLVTHGGRDILLMCSESYKFLTIMKGSIAYPTDLWGCQP